MNMQMNDKLDLIIALVGKNCGQDDIKEFDNIDTSEVKFSKRYYRKKARIVGRYQRAPRVLTFKKGLVRVAIALVVLMALGFTTIMALPSLREAVFEAVIEWYENYLAVRYERVDDAEEDEAADVGDNETPTAELYSTMENLAFVQAETLPPLEIEEVRKPTYLPEGVTENVVVQNKTLICIDYYLNGELVYTYKQMLLKERDKYINNETAIVETIDINDNIGTIIQHDDKSEKSIVWADNLYVYHIFALNTDFEQLIIAARSVQ